MGNTFFFGGEHNRLNLFCFLHPLHRLGLPIMKLPASCLNEGFVIKGYFTANSWVSLILVYVNVESSLCSPLVNSQKGSQTFLVRRSSPLSFYVKNLKICLTKAKPVTSSVSIGTWGFIVNRAQTAWKCKVNAEPNQHKVDVKWRT